MSKDYDGNTVAQIVGTDNDTGFDFTINRNGVLQNGWRCHGIRRTLDREETLEVLDMHCGEGVKPEDIWGKRLRKIWVVSPYNDDPIGIGRTMQDAIDDANQYLEANEYTLSELTDEPEVED